MSDMDTGLAFFDECVDKVRTKGVTCALRQCHLMGFLCQVEQDETDGVKLMDTNEGGQSERTVFVMPPEATGLQTNVQYEYNAVFKLDQSLFGSGRTPYKTPLNKFLQNVEYATPGSPVAKRTKQEIKSAKKNARIYSEKPMQWAKCLLSTCYRLAILDSSAFHCLNCFTN